MPKRRRFHRFPRKTLSPPHFIPHSAKRYLAAALLGREEGEAEAASLTHSTYVVACVFGIREGGRGGGGGGFDFEAVFQTLLCPKGGWSGEKYKWNRRVKFSETRQGGQLLTKLHVEYKFILLKHSHSDYIVGSRKRLHT